MARVRLILKLVGAGFAFAVYVWFAAVRNVPKVRARKARRRAARRVNSERLQDPDV